MNCEALIYFLTGSFYDLEKEQTQITEGHEQSRSFSIITLPLAASSLELYMHSPHSL